MKNSDELKNLYKDIPEAIENNYNFPFRFSYKLKKVQPNLPSIKIKAKDMNNKFNIIDLVIISKLEKSKSEIRRLIKGNAIKLDDKIISNEKLIITNKIFKDNYLKLSIGKKRHIKIELN